MRVEVRLHGGLRELLPVAARGRGELELLTGAAVADLLAQLGVQRTVGVACNNEEVPATHALQDGDKIAIFSAVSGGHK